jgi:RNA polymerase sigma-B factor
LPEVAGSVAVSEQVIDADSFSAPGSTRGPGPGEQLADTDELLARLADTGDPAVREELVRRFMPLARRLAFRYRTSRESLDDLVQVASVALIKCLDRYDPDRGAAFTSYAVPSILGELKRHFRDHGWSTRVSRDIQELVPRVNRVTTKLTTELSRPPTVNEIAERLEMDPEDVLETVLASDARHARSLDTTFEVEGGDHFPLVEQLGGPDSGFEAVEDVDAIRRAARILSERDRLVLELRFSKDMTQSEIAERIGCSQMQVSRILRAAIGTLREELGAPR